MGVRVNLEVRRLGAHQLHLEETHTRRMQVCRMDMEVRHLHWVDLDARRVEVHQRHLEEMDVSYIYFSGRTPCEATRNSAAPPFWSSNRASVATMTGPHCDREGRSIP